MVVFPTFIAQSNIGIVAQNTTIRKPLTVAAPRTSPYARCVSRRKKGLDMPDATLPPIVVHPSTVAEIQVTFKDNRRLYLLSTLDGFVAHESSAAYVKEVFDILQHYATLYQPGRTRLTQFAQSSAIRRASVTAINNGRNPNGTVTIGDRLYIAIPGSTFGTITHTVVDITVLSVHKD